MCGLASGGGVAAQCCSGVSLFHSWLHLYSSFHHSRKTPDFDDSDLTTLASGYTSVSGSKCSRVGGRGMEWVGVAGGGWVCVVVWE